MCIKKHLVILGGLGVIGQILWTALSDDYDILMGDLVGYPTANTIHYQQIDVTNYDDLCRFIPTKAHAVINLTAMPRQERIVDVQTFQRMMAVYGQGAYNILQAANEKGVKKVILASSNHVTGMSEEGGISLTGNEIDLSTYPKPDDIYGGFKLAQESWARVMSDVTELSVICLRIGTVVADECTALRQNQRTHRTLLSHVDCATLFRSAIDTDVKFGVYYGVSQNFEKPWSIRSVMDELSYQPTKNSQQRLEECLRITQVK
ncbi:MAG: NAD(P)-dependent oxidoreductase [Chloroflexota bacterium]